MSQRRSYIARPRSSARRYTSRAAWSATPAAGSGSCSASTRRATRGRRSSPLPVGVRAGPAAALGRTVYVVGGDDARRAAGGRCSPTRSTGARGAGARRCRRRATTAPRSRSAGRSGTSAASASTAASATSSSTTRRANRWRAGRRCRSALDALGAVVFRGGIWAIGGIDRERRPPRSVWISTRPAGAGAPGRGCPTGMELPARPSRTGGSTRSGSTRSSVYDPRTGRWSRGPSPQVPRHALALFARRRPAVGDRRLHGGPARQPGRRGPAALRSPNLVALSH